MGRIVVSTYLTLDGVMDEPGLWSMPYWDDETAKFKSEEMYACDALLLGRITYEGFAAAWSNATDEEGFAEMNAIPKIVVSTTLAAPEWNNTRLIKDDVANEIARLKQQLDRDILVYGSANLTNTLVQHDLVDEYRLMIYPLVLGSGKRFFSEGGEQKTLRLVETKALSSGVVILTYHPA